MIIVKFFTTANNKKVTQLPKSDTNIKMCYFYVDENGNEIGGTKQDAHMAMQRAHAQKQKREEQAARQLRIFNGRDIVYAPATDHKDGIRLRDKVRFEVCCILYNHCRGHCSELHRLIRDQGRVQDPKIKEQMLIDIAHHQCDVIKIITERLHLPKVVQQLLSYYEANIANRQQPDQTKEWRNFHYHSLQSIPARLKAALPKYLKWGMIHNRDDYKPPHEPFDPQLFGDWAHLDQYGSFDMSFVKFD